MGLFWAYQGQQKKVHLPSGLDPALTTGREKMAQAQQEHD